MGGVLACFAICFAGISTVAIACCLNRPVRRLPESSVAPVSPVVEEHRVPVLVQHPDDSNAVVYEPQSVKRGKKRRCCRGDLNLCKGDLNLCNFTGWF